METKKRESICVVSDIDETLVTVQMYVNRFLFQIKNNPLYDIWQAFSDLKTDYYKYKAITFEQYINTYTELLNICQLTKQ